MRVRGRRQQLKIVLRRRLAGLVIATAPLSAATASAAEDPPSDAEVSRIQVIASYHRGNLWADELLARLDEAAKRLGVPALDVDYLDARRLGTEQAFSLQQARLEGRHAVAPSDRLLLIDDAALRFYMTHPAAWRQSSRVVAIGINDPALQRRARAAGIKRIDTTEVAESSLAFLSQAFGGPPSWLVLGDDTPVGRDLTRAFVSRLEASPSGRLADVLWHWTPATVRDALKTLPDDTRVYVVEGQTTGNGDLNPARRGWLDELDAAGVPVFCHLPYQLELGCAGGVLLDTRRVATLAIETLLSPAFAHQPARQVVSGGRQVLDARWHARVPAPLAASIEWVGVNDAMQQVEGQRSMLLWAGVGGGGAMTCGLLVMGWSRRRMARRQRRLMIDQASGLPSQQLWEADAPVRAGCLFELASPQLREARERFGLTAAQSMLREQLPAVREALPDDWRLYAGTGMNLLGWAPAAARAEDVETYVDSVLARLSRRVPDGGQRLSWHASLLLLDGRGTDIAQCRDALDEGVGQLEQQGWQQPLRRVTSRKPVSATRFRHLAEALEAMIEAPESQWRLVFQPQVEPRGHRLKGAEVLLRWRHPEFGEISPGEFLPVAESLGLTRRLDHWVADEAIAWLGRHRRVLDDDFRLSINVGLATFEDDGFAASLGAALMRHALPAACLEIEITEHADFGELPRLEAAMIELRRLGVRLSLDDFGTGYTAFRLLQRLPFDAVKLDRELLEAAGRHARAVEAYEAMVQFCYQLGLEIVAEGVETEAQLSWLTSLEVQLLQGYYLGRPCESEAFLTRYGQCCPSGTGR
ncbi:EAL domain-containing protein [Halomonas getboli]|uniref:EAL domain-containing protein n=1 Tax=Halomonas getboli TaxID=2935862 RepID=UPI001FFF4068|nr:EAL domain-containing protein [Halomonas getboli]MCK2183109.1 EAL domain-containing protein [Halomonas getboli]